VKARTEEGRKEGRAMGEEGRISKDGRRLITPRDIRSFTREAEGNSGKRKRWRTPWGACAHVETRRTRARSNAKYIRHVRNP